MTRRRNQIRPSNPKEKKMTKNGSERDQHPLAEALIAMAEECETEPSEQRDPYEYDSEQYDEYAQRMKEIVTARAKNLISAARLVQTKHAAERSFLIGPDLLPKQGRMLITGKSGTGKSTLTLHLAACLASKDAPFGLRITHNGPQRGESRFPVSEASTVLYIDYELPGEIRAEKRIKPLIPQLPKVFLENLFFAPYPSLYRLHNLTGEHPGSGSFDALQTLMEKVRPDVLILDPLSSAHALDENSISIKQALNNADRLIELYGCAVIIVHHASTKVRRDQKGKQLEKDPIEEPRGHSSLVDWCDVHLHFAQCGIVAREDDDGEEQDEGPKMIEMSFGKARYCRKPDKRRLSVNFKTMEVRAIPKGNA
jgi:energy-coupling factor transporter ATP-binding protein EcfA2